MILGYLRTVRKFFMMGVKMKRALLVGINKYKIAGADLNGCVNDVTNLRDILLKYFGFDIKDIKVMTDERATKLGIMDGLKWLTEGVKTGDSILFAFSGHGSQIVDKNNDEYKDNLDEILCPHDMDWDGTYIVDDELNEIFSKVDQTVNIEVILDSCHSGTGTREIKGLNLLPKEETLKIRFLKPPVDIDCRMDEDMEVVKLFSGIRAKKPDNRVVFTGCKDNQTSADAYINGTYNGAFTYYFCKYLREAQGKINRLELLKRVRSSLKYHGFSQIPQLECAKNEKIKNLLE